MSAYNDVAKNGVMNVESDHMNTANVNTCLPPYFLAALPPSTYNEHKKDFWISQFYFLITLYNFH